MLSNQENIQLKVNKINEYTYSITERGCTVYLIIGSKKAMVIDFLLPGAFSLLAEIRKYTQNELIPVLTHGHIDHTGHLDEFKTVYLAEEDLHLLSKQNVEINYLTDRQEFDLGNLLVKAYKIKGHTNGSVIFIDEKSHNLFTGDEFGSGCGVWMQLNDASDLSTYIREIDKFKAYLIDNYKISFYDWHYYPGHLGQEYSSKVSPYNPLDSYLIDDLKELSVKLINKEVELIESPAKQGNNEQSYYASYKKAEMITRKSLIK
ncbi:MAG TPA: MBL fold metallo-hydrolase [Bacilli bacterium]|nr:MBL fold metallo-hydrolase [Acholeplasmataceae bacterium]OQB61455.1 MAG: putative polyketide biosynthesis zinc-dependent hydrolase PksB [Tenericutes bacterium ADurb.Bin140]HOE77696.1 MBL fold metallo-hydrolase [Bacilli bacterium]HON64314.1 MBL fold metallo-hydrolase [Bacilli bacterium]HPD13074.1 MBL fold metallo-hydrolase [Bacilli bacterium]